MRITLLRVASAGVLAAAAFVVFVPSYTGVPRAAEEVGYPQQVLFHGAAEQAAVNQAPPAIPVVAAGGPTAAQTYKNVQVLGDVSAAEFMRLQTAMTAWVSPQAGCSYCHVGNDFASDAKPQKAAARVMLQMTRHLNADWAKHVAPAGVTCFSCHRGQPVPAQIWFPSTPPPHRRFVAPQDNWIEAADTVRKFFPDASYAEYLYDDQPIAVQSTTVAPSGGVSSFVEAKRIYEMMMTMSDGIGVNCGYCHNSRAFQSWAESTPYRWVGYDALRLLRDINRNYLSKIATLVPQTRLLTTETAMPVLPANQRGPQLGNGLALCATCHVGITKPLNGANVIHDFPELIGPPPPPPKSAAASGSQLPAPG